MVGEVGAVGVVGAVSVVGVVDVVDVVGVVGVVGEVGEVGGRLLWLVRLVALRGSNTTKMHFYLPTDRFHEIGSDPTQVVSYFSSAQFQRGVQRMALPQSRFHLPHEGPNKQTTVHMHLRQ